MFDTLTDGERLALRGKLADWGHRFAETGHTLAAVAHASDPYDHALWQHAERFYAVMGELHVLRAEVAA